MHAPRFPGLSEVSAPAGAEGWEEMFNWYHLRGEERREQDDGRFWFQDRLHHSEALYPYDEIQCECWWQALGAFNTRIFAMPPAYGVDQRVVNGYLYISPLPAEPGELERRAELFERRAGHYYEQWDLIYGAWKDKVLKRLEELKTIAFTPLPEIEDESVVYNHVGYSSGYRMVRDFARMVLLMYETYQYHFELLNLGYAAYLTFFRFCRDAFPDIPDQSITQMVGGQHVELYRPDDELKRLSKAAVRLGIDGEILGAASAGMLFARLRAKSPAAAEWVKDWERTADPWFVICTDPGHPGGYHHHKTWVEDPDVPLAAVKEYVTRVRAGDTIDRPTERVLAERERITYEYRALLSPEDRPSFDEVLELARKVFVYIEEHVLYIEHWMWGAFWRKSHELSRVLHAMGGLDEPEDMFYLRRSEVNELVYDVVAGWSVGSRPRGADYWRPIVARRREMRAALVAWEPPPALGAPPDEVSEPFTVMLWGITTESIASWLSGTESDDTILRGVPGSPGVVEGPARIVTHVSELGEVREGEILICPATSPSWSPIFSRVRATVSDVGGVMSHTAIVCREYGLPAVVGTGRAVSTLRNGQRIRVDGGAGTVSVLD